MGLVDNSSKLSGVQPFVLDWAVYTMKLFQLYTGGKLQGDGSILGGILPVVTSGYRNLEEQQRLRREWEAAGMKPYPVKYKGKTVYPANLPGDSSHNWGFGWDSDVSDQYMHLWRYVRAQVGWVLSEPAGKDDVHAEWPNWREIVRANGYTLPR